MAALLLGQGARRIGGSLLHRTQAALISKAVAEERRRLVPRRMYTTEEQAAEELTRKIQQKKEELYDVVCKAEQSFWTSSFSNKRLLQHLSVQAVHAFYKKGYQCGGNSGACGINLCGLFCCACFGAFHFRDTKVARDMMMQEMREASSDLIKIKN